MAPTQDDPLAEYKRAAALAAAAEVGDGMVLGLGTGSTARHAILAIGERYAKGELKGIVGVPTSDASAALAASFGVPLLSYEQDGALDLAIDGADEVDPCCNLIKGGGGALLREKLVERHARRLLIIVDETKLSDRLGTYFALPVEVLASAWQDEQQALEEEGCLPVLRARQGQPWVTDNGNYILDCRFADGICDAYGLAARLDARPAVRAHGLFLDMAHEVIVAGPLGLRRLAVPRRRPCLA